MFKPTSLFILALLWSNLGFAQISWESLNGPTGAQDMKIMATDQSGRIFLLHAKELFTSLDDGDTWMLSTAGIPAEEVGIISEILVLPTGKVLAQAYYTYYQYDPNTNIWSKDVQLSGSGDLSLDDQQRLWRVANGNLYFSNDGGQSFNLSLSGQQLEGSFNRMANHNDQHNLVAVTNNSQSKLYHFNTSGTRTLVKESSGFHYLGYNAFSETAFASDFARNWRSTDGGLSWAEIVLHSNPNSSYSQQIQELYAVSPTMILALSNYGMFVSEDDGINWAPLPGILQSSDNFYRTPAGIFFSSRNCSYSDFVRSTDQGTTWTDLSQSFYYPTVDKILVAKNGGLFARNCFDRYEFSNDEGQNWLPLINVDSSTLEAINLARYLVVQPDGELFSITTDHYIVHSSDNGTTWSMVTQPVDPATNEDYFTIQTDAFGNLYAIYDGHTYSYKSADNAQTWQPIRYSPSGFAFGPDFLFAPNGDIYYLDQFHFPQRYLAGQDSTVFETITTTNGDYLDVYSPVITAQGDLLFMNSTGSSARLYRYRSGQGTELINFPGAYPSAITAAPTGLTFVVSQDSLFQSENSGSNWTFLGKTPAADQPFEFKVRNDQRLYLSYDQHTPYRSVQSLSTGVHESVPAVFVQPFPNPFHDYLHFQVTGLATLSNYRLLLTDALGRVVRQARCSDGDLQLSRRDLVAGMYFYAILNEQGRRVAAGRVVAD